jgi:hypothetical protein
VSVLTCGIPALLGRDHAINGRFIGAVRPSMPAETWSFICVPDHRRAKAWPDGSLRPPQDGAVTSAYDRNDVRMRRGDELDGCISDRCSDVRDGRVWRLRWRHGDS